jgi:hypothetical protein
MCFKTPKAPAVQSRPQRDEKASLVQDNRRRTAEQGGVFSSIFTSALGDSEYGKSGNQVATLRSA